MRQTGGVVPYFVAAWAAFKFEVRWQGAWMGWNLLLAVIPAAGALVLTRWPGRRRWGWWATLAAVAALLPNAPYVVTDLVHLPAVAASAPSRAAIVVGVLPLFAILVAGGLTSYVLCLRLLRLHLRRRGWSRGTRLAIEAAVHLACAVGIVLGRLPRLNTWDLLHPAQLGAGLPDVAAHWYLVGAVLLVIVAASLVSEAAAVQTLRMARRRVRWPSRQGLDSTSFPR
jgi:uncharacterized membrane protein